MKKRPLNPARHVLLTGAGFTANFGGFLSWQVWERIFNRVQAIPDLTKTLLADQDWEAVYTQVLAGEYPADVKEALRRAVLEAFQELDETIRGWTWAAGSAFPVNEYAVRGLIARFAGQRSVEDGFFFTLNQDLFVERRYTVSSSDVNPIRLPGILNTGAVGLGSGTFGNKPFDPRNPLRLGGQPDAARGDGELRGFNYVKLHGSYGWQGETNETPMITGRGKRLAIAGSDLFSWYFETFERVLATGGRRLLIIGYGFGDEHVNEALRKAIRDSGLQIAIMNTLDPGQLIPRVKEALGSEAERGLIGVHTIPLREMYPADQSSTEADRAFKESFFGNVRRIPYRGLRPQPSRGFAPARRRQREKDLLRRRRSVRAIQ